MFFNVKIEKFFGWQFEAIFHISGVWHVGWWNLITSVCLVQVGNNRNDHFRYFLGVRVLLIKVWGPLNTGFTVLNVLQRESEGTLD